MEGTAGRSLPAGGAVLLAAAFLAPWGFGGTHPLAAGVLPALLLAAAGSCRGQRGLLEARAIPSLAVGVAVAGALARLALEGHAVGAGPVLTLFASLAVFLAWSEIGRGPAVRLGAVAVLGVCVAQGAFGALQWSLGPRKIYGATSGGVTAPFGSYVNHNHFAGLVEMGALLAAGMTLGRLRRDAGVSSRGLLLGGATLGLVAVHLASRSRGGVIALAGGAVALAVLWASYGARSESGVVTSGSRSRRLRPLLVGVVGAALVLALGLAAVPGRARAHLATVLQGASDASGDYRLDTYRDTLRMIAVRPILGWGLGSYADAFTRFKSGHGDVRTEHAESDVLEFTAETGLVGWLLLGWIGWHLWRGFADRMRHGRDPYRRGIAIGAMAACVGLAVHSLFDFNLRIPANALVFCTLLGLASAPKTEPRRIGGPWLARAVAVLLVLLALAAAWRAHGAWTYAAAMRETEPRQRIRGLDAVLDKHPYLAEAYRERGRLWRAVAAPGGTLSAERLRRAEADLESAVRLRPLWGEAWADLGWVQFLEGRREEADATLRKAVELDPTNVTIGVALADFLGRTGRQREGLDELQRLRRANPWWGAGRARQIAAGWGLTPELLAQIQ